jgi:hypothetical protein
LYSISYSQVEHAVVIKHAYNVVYWRPRGCAVCTQLLLGLRLLLCSRSRPHQRSRLRLLRFRARLRSRSGLYLLSLSLRMCFRTCQTSRLSTQRLSPRLSLVHRIEDARLRSCRSGSDKQSCLRRDLRLSLRRFESRGCDKLSCNRRDGARLRRNESRGSMKLSSLRRRRLTPLANCGWQLFGRRHDASICTNHRRLGGLSRCRDRLGSLSCCLDRLLALHS